MNVRDCMKSPVFTVTPDTLIDNAMETMREKRQHHRHPHR